MPLYQIRGVPVDFPYDAYDIQLKYMEKVIQALQEKKHALLESPTGTGKTLCLLCATLAWRQSGMKACEKAPLKLDQLLAGLEGSSGTGPPPIIYSSRTHSQLGQALKEIKKTKYKLAECRCCTWRACCRVRVSVLGSRQQQCCNPKLRHFQGTAKNHACTKLVKSKACQWHLAADNETDDAVYAHAGRILDIEDLNKLAGKGSGPCPYYLSRKMAAVSDIVFVPYNYLVEKHVRRSIESLFRWERAVVIFDEAHNIEKSCSEAASFDLPVDVLKKAVLELEKAQLLCARQQKAETAINDGQRLRQRKQPTLTKSWTTLSTRIYTLTNMINKLESNLSRMKIGRDGLSFDGKHIFNIFSDACITDQNWKVLTDTLTDVAELLAEAPVGSNDETRSMASQLNGMYAGWIADALEKAFDSKESPKPGAPPYHTAYRVHIHDDRVDKNKNQKPRIALSYWCFSPGIAMQSFVSKQQIQSVILTSGTLSPLDSFAAELQLPFEIRLENEHIISDKQAFVGCVHVGPNGWSLNSSFKCRDDPRYKEGLGMAVVKFVQTIPGGVLMFFPSYIVLKNCIESWKDTQFNGMSIWNTIGQFKAMITEPQKPEDFPAMIREYQAKVASRNSRGCILFAVCRGKVSEGIDFSDDAGRAVIIAGVPYAQFTDPKVKLKREFLDRQKGSLTGAQWYSQTAIRAVNQALGRVIRHKDDFGAILLCDQRFGERNTQGQLSKWLRSFFRPYNTFEHALSGVKDFFKMDRSTLKRAKEELKPVKKGEPTVSAVLKRASVVEELKEMVVSPKRQRLRSPSPNSTDKTQGSHTEPCAKSDTKPDVRTEYSQNPREFMSQLRDELSEAAYNQLRDLLTELKGNQKNVGAISTFQNNLIDLLFAKETRHLLPSFAMFLPSSQREAFFEKIRAKQTSVDRT